MIKRLYNGLNLSYGKKYNELQLENEKAVMLKDMEIMSLETKMSQFESKLIQAEKNKEIAIKDKEIAELKLQVELASKNNQH